MDTLETTATDSSPAFPPAASGDETIDATSETIGSTNETNEIAEPVEPPPLALAGTTKARCPTCGHEASWTGAIGIPECPNGHGPLTVVAMTGHTAEDAFRLAGEQLPDRVETPTSAPQQMRLPGTRTPFDFESAMRSILEQRREVRAAESVAEERSAAATRAKKRVTELQESLSTLEDEYGQRVSEMDLEANLTPDQRADRRAASCRFEERTGQPCPVCRGEQTREVANALRGHLVDALEDLDTVTPALVQRAVSDACGLALDTSTIADLIENGTEELFAWIRACAAAVDQGADVRSISTGAIVERPEAIGRPHVVGVAGTCADCGAIVQPLAAQLGLEVFVAGQMVGVDCPGAEAPHAVDWQLLGKLREAGADVDAEKIYDWTPDERESAWRWAEVQIAASAAAEPGTSESMRWPEHVSRAVHGDVEPARKPRPRHSDPKTRQAARNAATKADRQGKAEDKPARSTPVSGKRSQSKAARGKRR